MRHNFPEEFELFFGTRGGAWSLAPDGNMPADRNHIGWNSLFLRRPRVFVLINGETLPNHLNIYLRARQAISPKRITFCGPGNHRQGHAADLDYGTILQIATAGAELNAVHLRSVAGSEIFNSDTTSPVVVRPHDTVPARHPRTLQDDLASGISTN